MKISVLLKGLMVVCLLILGVEKAIAACEESKGIIELDYTLDMSKKGQGWVKIGKTQFNYKPSDCALSEDSVTFAYSSDLLTAVDSPVGLVVRARDVPFLYYKLSRPNGDAYARHNSGSMLNDKFDDYVTVEYYIDYSDPDIKGGVRSSGSLIGYVDPGAGENGSHLYALSSTLTIRGSTCTLEDNGSYKSELIFPDINTNEFGGIGMANRKTKAADVWLKCTTDDNPKITLHGVSPDGMAQDGLLENTVVDGAKGVSFYVLTSIDNSGSIADYIPAIWGETYPMIKTQMNGYINYFLPMEATYWKYSQNTSGGKIVSVLTFDITYE